MSEVERPSTSPIAEPGDPIVTAFFASAWAGALTDPRSFSAFPVAVQEAILTMAEREQEHRHQLDGRRAALAARGQFFAFIIAITFGVFALVAIVPGHDLAGTALGGSTLVALTAVFITGKRTGERLAANEIAE